MKFYHILGPVLAIVATLFWANALVKRDHGKEYNIIPRLVVFGVVVVYHLLFNGETFFDKVTLLAMDFGIALIINTAYLAFHKTYPKVFLGLGSLALAVSGVMWGAGYLIGITWRTVDRADAETVLVEIGPDDNIRELRGVLSDFNADYEEAYPMVDMDENEDLAQTYIVWVAAEDEMEFMQEIGEDVENVDFVEENKVIPLWPEVDVNEYGMKRRGMDFGCNDPDIQYQWWFGMTQSQNMFASLDRMQPRKKAVVAIVDTGVNSDHEDIKDVFGKSPNQDDYHGHGSHCAGLAGAATNNELGIASLNYEGKFIEVRSYQGLSEDGSGGLRQLTGSIIQAAEDGADVISLSLGGPIPFRSMRKAIEYAQSQGAIVVAAAGNDNKDAKRTYPTAYKGVISVAATDRYGNKAFFSNTNTSLKMPISAPGHEIWSLSHEGGYRNMSGTSMACPIVAGYLGFIRSMDPDISAKEAYKLLKQTGDPANKGDKIGNIVDAEKIVAEMEKRAS